MALEDLIADVFKLDAKGHNIAHTIFDTISGLQTAVGFVEFGVNVVSFLLGKDDELKQVLAEIQKNFSSSRLSFRLKTSWTR